MSKIPLETDDTDCPHGRELGGWRNLDKKTSSYSPFYILQISVVFSSNPFTCECTHHSTQMHDKQMDSNINNLKRSPNSPCLSLSLLSSPNHPRQDGCEAEVHFKSKRSMLDWITSSLLCPHFLASPTPTLHKAFLFLKIHFEKSSWGMLIVKLTFKTFVKDCGNIPFVPMASHLYMKTTSNT